MDVEVGVFAGEEMDGSLHQCGVAMRHYQVVNSHRLGFSE